MPQLANSSNCCGCAACIDVCTKNAITLTENENGFYMPTVDKNHCVECHACEKTCFVLHNHEISHHNPEEEKPYAAWSLDEEIIKNTASGGVFSQIATDFLTDDNHVVYGAFLQNDSTVKHIEITDKKDLHKLRNSKYQQSICEGIYKQIKKRLKEGKIVLFSGVPCQISALYSFLKTDEKLTENLYTTEVICHGVPSNYIHRFALKVHQADRIVKYRTKSRGWLDGNRLTYAVGNQEKECSKTMYDFLFRTYLTMNWLRENCYQCPCARIDRSADLTLGDFWGHNEKYNNYNGVSLVIVNSKKGKNLFLENKNLHIQPTTFEECFPENQNLYMPTNVQHHFGGKKIHRIKNWPFILQKLIFQEGLNLRFIDAILRRTLLLLRKLTDQKKTSVKNQKMNQALNLTKTK